MLEVCHVRGLSARGDAVTSVTGRPVPVQGAGADRFPGEYRRQAPSQGARPGPSHRAQERPPSVRTIKEPGRANPRAVLTLLGAGVAAVIVLWWRGTPSVTGL